MEIKLSLVQEKKIKAIAQKYGVVFAVVFGSAAKGTKTKESDFDLAVLTREKPSYQLFKNLFSEFSEVFKGENVDLRFLNEADPLFRFQVVKEGKLLYGHPQAYTDFKIYALKIFLDNGKKYFPYLERLLEKNQKALEAKIYD